MNEIYLRHKKALVHVNLHKWDFTVFSPGSRVRAGRGEGNAHSRKCQDTERHKKWKMIRNKKKQQQFLPALSPDMSARVECHVVVSGSENIKFVNLYVSHSGSGGYMKQMGLWEWRTYTRKNKQRKMRKRGNLRERKQPAMGNSRHDKKWNGIISDGKKRPSWGSLTRWTSKGSLSFVQTLFEDFLMNFSPLNFEACP